MLIEMILIEMILIEIARPQPGEYSRRQKSIDVTVDLFLDRHAPASVDGQLAAAISHGNFLLLKHTA